MKITDDGSCSIVENAGVSREPGEEMEDEEHTSCHLDKPQKSGGQLAASQQEISTSKRVLENHVTKFMKWMLSPDGGMKNEKSA